jgi:3-hydroxyisobutyrate dehydrogenase-like beta-hydroxyacid dehydrogenase
LAATKALEGVKVLPSIASAFERDTVVTMLSDDTAVRSVIIDSGALASAQKDCVHVMMSTISLALVEELQELHRREGIAYVAAPVFGVPAVL